MKTLMTKIWNDESGATAIEYGLIAALVSVAAVAALTSAGGSLSSLWGKVDTDLKTGVGSAGAGG